MNHMERLRNAAPAAPSPAIDRDLLLSSIVARPGDPALARSRPRLTRATRRRLTIVLVALAIAALTAATALATGFLGWHDETALIEKPQQWESLYQAATRSSLCHPARPGHTGRCLRTRSPA